jgi:DNA polymerase-3 subunit epsilon
MLFIYIQTIKAVRKTEIPYRLIIGNDEGFESNWHFKIRPQISIPKKEYLQNKLNRLEFLSAPPFCDIADELIDIFQGQQLVFSEVQQFKLLQSQFKTIGYNFITKPIYLWSAYSSAKENFFNLCLQDPRNIHDYSLAFAEIFLENMIHYKDYKTATLQKMNTIKEPVGPFNLSDYKMAAGVYFFLNNLDEVIYVGKAKNVRKRLQSHFYKPNKHNAIDYALVKSIEVEYTGHELIAELIESERIKDLKPEYNIQQIETTAPFIINKTKSAKGISKLKITRKDIEDNMPERYFNRISVKQALANFCFAHQLCRKYCGLETVKGPCSKVTQNKLDCICSGKETIPDYNQRFEKAFVQFQNRKSRKIYKLSGRHTQEDAFIYLVNDVYLGYGFIDKEEIIANENDILSHLISQTNTYETSRIISGLPNKISIENVLTLST